MSPRLIKVKIDFYLSSSGSLVYLSPISLLTWKGSKSNFLPSAQISVSHLRHGYIQVVRQ
ncbi:hypothetical protein BDV36DRAFT_254201 [Aspergillus pseudocaelatus]|uniref:Uncharacterized protein n=1 Tax=Aspergillus pseudocaelatus TaxID=1825620 RepID=A0ABQ6WMI7_9EURO|nr:hypothetical protein BDV36DRAFT_254201 [Aspergillus pseudocaelatus]